MRLADDEVALLDSLAATAGLTRTDYVRQLLRSAAAGQRAPQRPQVAPQRPARARPAGAAASRTGPGWCPKCSSRATPQGHGQFACTLCDWKGKA